MQDDPYLDITALTAELALTVPITAEVQSKLADITLTLSPEDDLDARTDIITRQIRAVAEGMFHLEALVRQHLPELSNE